MRPPVVRQEMTMSNIMIDGQKSIHRFQRSWISALGAYRVRNVNTKQSAIALN